MCLFEIQITWRKVIRIATAFVKFRKLIPCSSEPHLIPFTHLPTQLEETDKVRGIELSD